MSAVEQIADALRARGWTLATAESCTGGLLAAECTSIAGSSDWFERGFVTYSNAAKVESLGVNAGLIARYGAVSGEVAQAMAAGALAHSRADIALALTGIAGPGGGSADKPVGLVWLGWAQRGAAASSECFQFAGDRAAVRRAGVTAALDRALRVARAS